MNVVLLISADAEWRAVKELFPHLEIRPTPFGESANLTLDAPRRGSRQVWRLALLHGGWGKISAAAGAQYAIDHFHPDLLINLGTCGGFVGRIETGTIILVERTLVYDILEQMGDDEEAILHYSTKLDLSWLDDKSLIARHPSVLRGLLVSADRDILAEDIPMLIQKYGAVAADWESGAIAWVAKRNGTRLLILRGVTDLVGAEGGEAYGDLALFHERTMTVMKALFELLTEWLSRTSL